jgi:hypothetical protein
VTESKLLDTAKAHVVDALADLEGPDDDIMPHFLWLGPYGMGLMPLYMMTDDDSKDQIASAMTASLVVGRATEAVFVSTSWAVVVDRDSIDDLELQRLKHGEVKQRPSEHPDRVEIVMLMHSTGEGTAMIHANVTRYPDKPPTLGDWEGGELAERASGRFGKAVSLGLRFVREMPTDLIEIIDDGWQAGEQQDLIARFMKVQHNLTGRPAPTIATIAVQEMHDDEPTPGQVIEGLFGTNDERD